jgi:hypothetical protein
MKKDETSFITKIDGILNLSESKDRMKLMMVFLSFRRGPPRLNVNVLFCRFILNLTPCLYDQTQCCIFLTSNQLVYSCVDGPFILNFI